MSKLYQCPYCKATTCDLQDPCMGCETFSEFLNAQRENSNVSNNIAHKELLIDFHDWCVTNVNLSHRNETTTDRVNRYYKSRNNE